jgi:hypothetical protein
MAEATSTETRPTKKAKKATPAPAPPPEGGLLTAWRSWAVIGVVLVGGVIAWKLLGSSYKGDVETICNAEKGSGFTIQKDASKVTQYVRAHLATPEGNQLYSTLSEAKLHDRAKRLRSEAESLKIDACPAVTSYEQVAADGDYRADLQRLCSSTTFSKLGELDDAERLAKLEDWIDKEARSPRTKELADPLRQGGGAERAKLLRETASKVDVFSCDVAKTLEGPVLPSKGKGPPMVRPYSSPQVNGVLPDADLAKALADVTPAMNDCYKKGLEKKPDLEGKLAVKVKIEPSGKVGSVAPADVSLPDRETAECVLQALKGMKVPPIAGPLVTALIPLELTTAGVAGVEGSASAPAISNPGGAASAAALRPSAVPVPASSRR